MMTVAAQAGYVKTVSVKMRITGMRQKILMGVFRFLPCIFV